MDVCRFHRMMTGLIGVYHDWCEPFNSYPRTFDVLHSRFLFSNLSQRCDIIDVFVEIDRLLRPGGTLLVRDTNDMVDMLGPILKSMHWSTTLYDADFLVAEKTFWRPAAVSEHIVLAARMAHVIEVNEDEKSGIEAIGLSI
ncbi:OLC1v1007592C1 [Oldenlandia corymbosa var. corymbosa]|uniref:Methyltransferase n=1 Tax=Oldenlandia corymbosa var. corymbosa TaxID=529605 RepID=A0AAV1DMD3_OLDCO|nr:OLC1v1007592C1 [Oldenlandia corymbosa var. corymbosa]